MIRLNGIDAPEEGQICDEARGQTFPCGKQTTGFLADLIAGEPVLCIPSERDAYGRLVSECAVAGRGLSQALVDQGLAWAYREYSDAYIADDGYERFGQIGVQIDGVKFAGLDWEAMIPQFAAPVSWPAKIAFLRFKAIGRMVRSAALLSVSMRSSVQNRHSPPQYLAMYLSASPKGASADTWVQWAVNHASNAAINGADHSCRGASRYSAVSPQIFISLR